MADLRMHQRNRLAIALSQAQSWRCDATADDLKRARRGSVCEAFCLEVTVLRRLTFAGFEIRPDERQLLVDGNAAALGARAFDLLMCLVEHRDRIVSKDELQQHVWPGLVVEESNLTVHVATLRKLLGPQAITTIAGRGYRFTATTAAEPNLAASQTPPPAPHFPGRAWTPTVCRRSTCHRWRCCPLPT